MITGNGLLLILFVTGICCLALNISGRIHAAKS